jgi:hypothetical protein
MLRETVLGALTAVNLVVLVVGLTRILPAMAQTGVLRGSGFELVDSEGRLRASISIQPEVAGASETVLFRLIQPDGQPAVKISASMTGAGLSFVGGDDESFILLDADGPEGKLRIVEQNKGETLISP